uniref:hypothetical protein n=1 Tax=Photorhabdus sp. CRCIA-P01 TaxID=2019570 RepID=UPI001E55890C|nr:hypothetical protein [Photorhabdus sp. CRCIA-P01]
MSNLEELYCGVDDFCQQFIPLWHQQLIENGLLKRRRDASLSLGEVMTILILFHMSHYRDFKTFYIQHVKPCAMNYLVHKPYISASTPNKSSANQMVVSYNPGAFHNDVVKPLSTSVN